MGEQRHYRRPSQHKRRPPQTVMPCGPEDTPERQSEHRAETEKQPPRQPREMPKGRAERPRCRTQSADLKCRSTAHWWRPPATHLERDAEIAPCSAPS